MCTYAGLFCIILNYSDFMAKIVNEANFAEILAGGKPVMIDFWATWCGPCRALAPTIDEIATEYEGRVEVAKCNVDDAGDLAARFGIRSIPTLLFFKGGDQPVDRLVGAVPKSTITEKLDNLL